MQVTSLLFKLGLFRCLKGLIRGGRSDVACLWDEEEDTDTEDPEEYGTNAKGLLNVSTSQR